MRAEEGTKLRAVRAIPAFEKPVEGSEEEEGGVLGLEREGGKEGGREGW